MNTKISCRKCYGWIDCFNREGLDCKILKEKQNESESNNKHNIRRGKK